VPTGKRKPTSIDEKVACQKNGAGAEPKGGPGKKSEKLTGRQSGKVDKKKCGHDPLTGGERRIISATMNERKGGQG